ncbi:TetR/AcrR family transcriptional regulator [Microbacterium tumbae]
MNDAERPMRADARRNRERLLEVAADRLQQSPDVPLEQIAGEAGVGIGTLYRNFPTREVLIDAVYRNELIQLCDSVPALLLGRSGAEALRIWMDRFLDYATTKQDMRAALDAVIASGGDPFRESRARLTQALSDLLAAGAQDGTLRADVDPYDALVAMSGVARPSSSPDERARSGRLLDLLLDAFRAR